MTSSVQLQKSLAFLASLDHRDHPTLDRLLHENFTHGFFPSSLNGFGKPIRAKQEFLDFVKDLESSFERFNFQPPKDIVEGKDVVVLHLVSAGKTIGSKPYNNEYIFTFRFQEGKIGNVREFIDSKYVSRVMEEEARGLSAE